MRLKKDSSEQKLRGAYYTPLQLADAIVELFASQNISTVLEPSCGDGVFIDALQNLNLLNKVDKLTAVEIEPDEAEKVRDRYSGFEQIEVCTEDFFNFYNRVLGKEQYDLILGNPPYIRYQYLKESQREMQSQILTSHGMKANKLINAWVAFIVACVQLLSEKGKIAFVIPAEILQVAYAEDLRLYLANNLAKITLITFERLVFPDIEQEVVVFIGEKGEEEKGIRIILSEIGLDTANRQVHLRHFPCRRIGILTIDRYIIDISGVALDELCRLYKHTTRTAARIVNTAFIRL